MTPGKQWALSLKSHNVRELSPLKHRFQEEEKVSGVFYKRQLILSQKKNSLFYRARGLLKTSPDKGHEAFK